MADIGMAAFSVFFMQSPSFLAHQRQLQEGPGHGRSNCETLFEMAGIPCDNHIRAMLDPVEPKLFFPVFNTAFEAMDECGGLDAFRQLGGHVLIALDGTEYFRSNDIHCGNCSTRARSGGPNIFTRFFRPPLSRRVTIASCRCRPNSSPRRTVARNRTAKVVPHDGGLQATAAITQSSTRCISATISCLASRSASQAAGGHFLFVCKPASHKTLQEWLDGVDLAKRVVAIKRGKKRFTYTYRWIEAVPLRDGDDAMMVNWLEIAIADAAGEVTYRNSFVTDLPVNADNVVEIAAAGRARWKIESVPQLHTRRRFTMN
jgi:hypothetical protein